MGNKVKVTANGQTFEVAEETQKRWPEVYPLAETASGKPTAATKRAKPAPRPEKPSTASADDLAARTDTDAASAAESTKENPDG